MGHLCFGVVILKIIFIFEFIKYDWLNSVAEHDFRTAGQNNRKTDAKFTCAKVRALVAEWRD